MPIRIVIADDHAIVRGGLVSLLKETTEYEVVGEACTGLQAVDLATRLKPDLALLDLSMPEMSGIEAARRIQERDMGTRIIILSMHADACYVRAAMSAGVDAYLLKQRAFEELNTAIHKVLKGGQYLTPGLHWRETDEPDAPASAVDKLTRREREVLALIATGMNGTEIAAEMNISPKTVDSYRERICTKLEVRGVANLTRIAIRDGLLSPDT
ncbi:MAG: response regulator [Gammaproteobacteria bacterium]